MDLDKLKAELIQEEGVVLRLYKDSLGIPTFGIGRNISSNPLNFEEQCYLLSRGTFTQDIAEHLLQNDINRIVRILDEQYPWTKELTDTRRRALANMLFQLGAKSFGQFTTSLGLLKSGRIEDCCRQLSLSLWARQTPSRAKRVIKMIEQG